MLVAAAVEELPRVDRVQAFVVAHGAVAQPDRPAEKRDDQQDDPEDLFDIQPQQTGQRAVEEASGVGFGVFHDYSRKRDA